MSGSMSRLALTAAVSLLSVAFAAGAAKATTVTFDEDGNFACDQSPCLFSGFRKDLPDPRSKVAGNADGNVLIYLLNPDVFRPLAFTETIVDETLAGELSDALSFTDLNGSQTGTASVMIFYSFDNLGATADVGAAPPGFCPPCTGPLVENLDGTFTFGGFVGGNVLMGVSACGQGSICPIPGPVVGVGLPGLILAAVVFSAGGDGGRKLPNIPHCAGFATSNNRVPSWPAGFRGQQRPLHGGDEARVHALQLLPRPASATVDVGVGLIVAQFGPAEVARWGIFFLRRSRRDTRCHGRLRARRASCCPVTAWDIAHVLQPLYCQNYCVETGCPESLTAGR